MQMISWDCKYDKVGQLTLTHVRGKEKIKAWSRKVSRCDVTPESRRLSNY